MCDTYKRREIVTLINGPVTKYKPKVGIQNAVGFKIIKISCANCFYNIIRGVNDRFDWLDNSGNPRFCVINPGQYDYVSLATAFQTACNLVGAETFAVTYDLVSKKYNINTNLAITPQWVSGANTAINISFAMGYYNDTTGNETLSVNHKSDFPAQLVPSHYLLRSNYLASARKGAGGAGGTQIGSRTITTSPQNYIITVPNQVDGTLATFAYRSTDDDNECFEFQAPRQIEVLDFELVHPQYPNLGMDDAFYSIYSPVTYEIEFTCTNRFK